MPATINNASSKITLKGLGDLLGPSAFCAVCGNGHCEKGYIDAGIYFDFEGQVYLCVTCVSQIAEVAGMLSLEETKHMQDMNSELAKENAELKEKVANYSEQLKQYDGLITGINERRGTNITISGSNAFAKQPEVDESNNHTIDELISDGEGNDSIVTESVKDDGRPDTERIERSDISF